MVISSSGNLIGTTFQENRQNESDIKNKKFFWSGNFGAYFKRGLSLSTKYLDTFCEAQVITKWVNNRPEPKKYAWN